MVGISQKFSDPWYTGTGANADTPYLYQVAIDGHGYIIDPEQYQRSTMQAMRQPVDQSVEPGEQCVDEETEILTTQGWKFHKDLRVGDSVLTYNIESGLSEWQTCDRVFRYERTGIEMLSMEGRQHSSLTTLGHRWPVSFRGTGNKRSRRFRTSETLTSNDSLITAANCGSLPTTRTYDDDFVEIVGWTWTEGNYTKSHNGSYIRRISIAQHPVANPEKVDRIRDCLTRLYGPPIKGKGWTWYEYRNPGNGVILFQLNPKIAPEILEVAPNKIVSNEFILALTQEQLDLFLEVSVLADGTRMGATTRVLTQKSREMIEPYFLATILAGRRTNMVWCPVRGVAFPTGPCWSVASNPSMRLLCPHANQKQGDGFKIETKLYTGTVWCPSTRNQTWMARRNGAVYFTGNSVNSEALWRRSQENWVLGAGQEYLDNRASTYNLFTRAGENQSIRYRFWKSKGVNPWTEGHLTLLPECEKKRSSAATNLKVLAVGGYLYVADGQEVYWTADPTVASPSWTAANIAAGGASSNVLGLATNGSVVWALLADKRINQTTAGAAVSTVLATLTGTTPGVVGYANGWLIATIDNLVKTVSSAGTITAVGSNPNASFVYTCITGAPNAIYVGGAAGIHGEVYSVTVDANTGALLTPVFATGLPFGEVPNALAYYGGYVVMATSEGVRLSDISRSDNALVYGPVITISGGSKCLDPYGEYCWFGWSNMSSDTYNVPGTMISSTGLGRVDLGRFTSANVPAYASDLMATDAVTGTVLSVAYFGGKHYFAVSGNGIWGENANKVATGWFQSGLIRFGTVEPKVLFAGDWRTQPLAGTVGLIVMKEDGNYNTLAEQTEALSLGPIPLTTSLPVGEAFQVQMYLKRSAGTTTAGPDLRRWTVRALATPQRMDEIIVPIIMKSEVTDIQGEGQDHYFDPLAEFTFLKTLETDGTVVIYQEGLTSYRVYVDRVSVKPEKWMGDRSFFNGMILVRLLTVPG